MTQGTTPKILTQKLDPHLQNIALTIAVISISLSSIVLVLISIIDSQAPGISSQIPFIAKLILLIAGTILVIASALTVDWIIDRFVDEEWNKALENPEIKILRFRWKFTFDKWNQIPARIILFNGGYSILCLSFAGIIFAILSQVPILLGTTSLVFYLAPVLFSAYIILQMMNYEKVHFGWAIWLTIGILIGSQFF